MLLTDFPMESHWIGEIEKLVNEVFGGISFYIYFYLTAGEVVSILALHGVFLLMQSHNLEYPGLYTKNPLYNREFRQIWFAFFFTIWIGLLHQCNTVLFLVCAGILIYINFSLDIFQSILQLPLHCVLLVWHLLSYCHSEHCDTSSAFCGHLDD